MLPPLYLQDIGIKVTAILFREVEEKKGSLPYHGPAVLDEEKLKKLFESNNAKFISNELVKEIKKLFRLWWI